MIKEWITRLLGTEQIQRDMCHLSTDIINSDAETRALRMQVADLMVTVAENQAFQGRYAKQILGHEAEIVGRVTNLQRMQEDWKGALEGWLVELKRMDVMAGVRAVERLERKIDWIHQRLRTGGHQPEAEPYPTYDPPEDPEQVPVIAALEQARAAMRWHDWDKTSDQASMEARTFLMVSDALLHIERLIDEIQTGAGPVDEDPQTMETDHDDD